MVFNNTSAISWWLVFLVDESEVPGENHRPAANNLQTLSHISLFLVLCSFFVYVTTGTTSGAGTAYPSGSP
jgi:hypothetical protein